MASEDQRLNLGRAAVLSLSRAASLLPMRNAEARSAIRRAQIIRWLEGREVVVWGDVLDRVLEPASVKTPPGPRGRGNGRRKA